MTEDDDGEVIYRVPVAMLMEMGDPVTTDVWGSGISWDLIRTKMSERKLHEAPVGATTTDKDIHAARIAHLAIAGWTDSICVSTSDHGAGWHILDGNHRLAAAVLAGMESIEVSPDGDLDIAEEMFGTEAVELFYENRKKAFKSLEYRL